MYENCKVYGPYLHSQGNRNIVVIKFPNGVRKTTAHARYLMETVLDRELTKEEVVDHINHDSLDDRLENLQVLTPLKNKQKRAEEVKAKEFVFYCPVCGNLSSIPYKQYRHNQLVQGKAGPYCSKSCSGKIHH